MPDASAMRGSDTYHPEDKKTEPHKWVYRFWNDTGMDICDFEVDTALTEGNDPDIQHIQIKSPNGTVYFDGSFSGETTVHVKLNQCIPKDKEFFFTFECNDWFEDDERIQITPTDAHDAAISIPTPKPPEPPIDVLELLKGLFTLLSALTPLLSRQTPQPLKHGRSRGS